MAHSASDDALLALAESAVGTSMGILPPPLAGPLPGPALRARAEEDSPAFGAGETIRSAMLDARPSAW